MFAELLAHPGVREELELRSEFGFLAFHGGSLEEGTDPVARRAAERAGGSLYAVVQPPSLRWHVPSRLVTPDASPRLAAFLGHVGVAVAIHGYGRDGWGKVVLLGGANRELAACLATELRASLPAYDVVDDLDRVPPELRGVHPANPVNRPPGGGVQVELPARARIVPHDADAVVGALAAAAEAWMVAA